MVSLALRIQPPILHPSELASGAYTCPAPVLLRVIVKAGDIDHHECLLFRFQLGTIVGKGQWSRVPSGSPGSAAKSARVSCGHSSSSM